MTGIFIKTNKNGNRKRDTRDAFAHTLAHAHTRTYTHKDPSQEKVRK